MKIGMCIGTKKSLFDAPQSADYLEAAATAIYDYDEETFRRVKAAVTDGTIRTYSCNVLIDSALRLTGPDVNFGAIREYCDRLFARLDELGIKMLVFGSGKAKDVPYGFPMEKAWNQLFELGTMMATKAEEHGQIIAVEPLSYKEVNIVNTVEDAVYYAKKVNRENFKVLVDFYHFDANGEDFASLERNRDWLVHAHFASQGTRTPPRSEEDWAFFTKCVQTLKRIGYEGHLSFEGRVAETDDLCAMLTRMKEIEQSAVI